MARNSSISEGHDFQLRCIHHAPHTRKVNSCKKEYLTHFLYPIFQR
uniref:Uncharacterized protein n=1 Tax=Arundo donax TaxID=35708 RepID=A0A0A9AK05_ARUDO